MLTTSFVPYEVRNWHLCIDEYTAGELAGRLYGSMGKRAHRFSSALPMLRLMEELMDDELRVQRYEQKRSFRSVQQVRCPSTDWRELDRRPGRLATFTVCIHFRQNATWQGEVVWMEQQQRTCFRSALELLFILDNALASTQNGAETCSG